MDYLYSWKNMPIVLTDHAYEKAFKINLSMWDIVQILEYSDDCMDSKREKGVFERCTKWAGNDIKIVFKKSFSLWLNCQSWFIITIIERR